MFGASWSIFVAIAFIYWVTPGEKRVERHGETSAHDPWLCLPLTSRGRESNGKATSTLRALSTEFGAEALESPAPVVLWVGR